MSFDTNMQYNALPVSKKENCFFLQVISFQLILLLYGPLSWVNLCKAIYQKNPGFSRIACVTFQVRNRQPSRGDWAFFADFFDLGSFCKHKKFFSDFEGISIVWWIKWSLLTQLKKWWVRSLPLLTPLTPWSRSQQCIEIILYLWWNQSSYTRSFARCHQSGLCCCCWCYYRVQVIIGPCHISSN